MDQKQNFWYQFILETDGSETKYTAVKARRNPKMERMTSKEAKRKTEQVLKKYREAGYDFNDPQIMEICLGYEHGLGDKTEDYISESLDWQTMKGFREGLEAGLDLRQIYICMDALERRDITIKAPGLTDEQFDVVKVIRRRRNAVWIR